MYEHNALGYWSGLTLCLTKVRSSRARCPATALIVFLIYFVYILLFTTFTFACMTKILLIYEIRDIFIGSPY